MKFDSYTRLFRFYITAGILFLGLSVALVGWGWESHRRSLDWVRHSYQVSAALSRTMAGLQDLQTSARDYHYTGDPKALASHAAAAARLDGLLEQVRILTADDPRQEGKRLALESLVTHELALCDGMIRSREEFHAAHGDPAFADDPVMARIRQTLSAMDAQVRILLGEREAEMETVRTRQLSLVTGLLAVQGIFVVALIWLGRRVAQLKRLVTVCAWSRKIRHNGEWMSFEEYLTRVYGVRLTHGISPEMAQKLMAEFETAEA